eukprot:s178_g24.t1
MPGSGAITELLNWLLDDSTQAILGIDAHGLVNEWNSAAAELFGFSRLEAFAPRCRFALKQRSISLVLSDPPITYIRTSNFGMQASFDAGCLLSLGALMRLAAAALNYEIYCILDGSPSSVPSITELSDHTGHYGTYRFSISLASVIFSDLCCYLVLSHAMSHGPFSSHFQGLLVASCFLDVLQALTTSFRYHYLPIQLAGFSMCLTLLGTLQLLWPVSSCKRALRVAAVLFTILCVDLLAVAILHNHWAAPRSLPSWTSLEYLGLALYTAVLVLISYALPPALVKFDCPPHLVPIECGKSLLPQHQKRKTHK